MRYGPVLATNVTSVPELWGGGFFCRCRTGSVWASVRHDVAAVRSAKGKVPRRGRVRQARGPCVLRRRFAAYE